jgi:hypothetical protein
VKLQNIDRVLLFRKDADDQVLMLDDLQAKYKIDPDGTNFYYGINQGNADNLTHTGSALNPTHKAFFAAVLASLRASPDDEKTIVLGVEPSEAPDPYGFVSAHLDLVRRLAADLSAIQAAARSLGKRLNIVVRYSSEMNDRGQSQGRDPSGYRSTFVQARLAFEDAAPNVLFSFSPALRADLQEALITQYWPGDDYVDVIGGTWYIGAPEQRAASIANMRSYFLQRTGTGKPFALSEMGGHDAAKAGNDLVLQDMLHELEALQLQSVSFKYVTIFLQGVWGTDATLEFLRPDASVAAV